MNPILRNILVVIGGIIIGMIVNMAVVQLSFNIVELPDGMDPMDPDSFQEHAHKLPMMAWVLALFAHGLGTLAGAWFISLFVTTKEKIFALAVGFFFMLGGIMNLSMIPHPDWFGPVDLIVAYIPMALLGYFIAMQMKKNKT